MRLLAQYLFFNPGEIKKILKDIVGLECLCVNALQGGLGSSLEYREHLVSDECVNGNQI
jgi:hypothetical protein